MQFLPCVLDYSINVVNFKHASHAHFLGPNISGKRGQVNNNNTLLAGLSAQDQVNIFAQCERRSVARKTVVVRQGAVGRDMFMVLSGSLRVSVVSDMGKEVSFVVLRQDDCFGELSMIDGRPRSATVSALKDTELLVLGHAGYQQLLQLHPHTATKFLTHLLTTLADRLRTTDELYQDSVFLEVPARLAKFLLNTYIEYSGSDPKRKQVDVRLSQYELGTLVNASRESVNKQLRAWENKGVVEINKGNIILLDLAVLEKEAQA